MNKNNRQKPISEIDTTIQAIRRHTEHLIAQGPDACRKFLKDAGILTDEESGNASLKPEREEMDSDWEAKEIRRRIDEQRAKSSSLSPLLERAFVLGYFNRPDPPVSFVSDIADGHLKESWERCKPALEEMAEPPPPAVQQEDGEVPEDRIIECPVCKSAWNISAFTQCDCGAQIIFAEPGDDLRHGDALLEAANTLDEVGLEQHPLYRDPGVARSNIPDGFDDWCEAHQEYYKGECRKCGHDLEDLREHLELYRLAVQGANEKLAIKEKEISLYRQSLETLAGPPSNPYVQLIAQSTLDLYPPNP